MRLTGAMLALLALSACSGAGESEAADGQDSAPAAQAPAGDETIECALAGGQWFLPECVVERAEEDGAQILIVRHPDGGFRRFELLTDGRGLAVADGSVEAVTEVYEGTRLDVSVGADRYRFPATVRGSDSAE